MAETDNADDIKSSLIEYLSGGCDFVVPEFNMDRGAGRIDLVAVTATQLRGYEIKSGLDTLNRLNRQVVMYDKIMDFMSIVATPKHMAAAREIVPTRWGLYLFRTADRPILQLRPPTHNDNQSDTALAALLWRDTMIDYLRRRGAYKSSYKSRAALKEAILGIATSSDIKSAVLAQMRKHGRKQEP